MARNAQKWPKMLRNGRNLWFAVKVISGEAGEVSGVFAVPRQAVNHTLGADSQTL